jgi:hypothetical protein
MAKLRSDPADSPVFLPPLPGWITTAPAETLEEAAFRSGAALAHLHLVAGQAIVPHALWRARLAVSAAEACVTIVGRREGVLELRDALYLLRPGGHPGPAGDILRQWSRAVARPILAAHLGKVLTGLPTEQISDYLKAADGNPVDRATCVLEAVLADAPRAETTALILADAALATALRWDHLLPLLSFALKPRDLRLRGEDLRLAGHRAVVMACGQAVTLAGDLARRAARLRSVVPQLRAKGAIRAVDLFLTQDALTPGALSGILSDRASRRLCDRLVDLGAVRELTGRDTCRLYGV